ncbi:MAG: ABC-type transport auxiliary lipoprotein family protein [Rhodospirillaceae bacterium]
MFPFSVAAAVSAAAVSACTINAPARDAPALYDFGPHASATRSERRIPGTLLIAAVTAPAWLDTTGIVYRLNYEDSNRLRAYNESRWVATPAMLLTEALRMRFAGPAEQVVSAADGAQADRVLRVDLEDYTQAFDAPTRSRVAIRARATLVDRRSRAVVAQQTFAATRDAEPNAAGAADALAECAGEVVENVLDWVAQKLKNSAAASTAERSSR